MLCLGLAAGFGFSAQAYELISPQEGVVNEVMSLGKITLQWDSDVWEFPEGQVVLYDSEDKQVATGNADFDFDAYDVYVVTFTPTITAPGTYKAVIPANMASDNSNREYTITYQIAEGGAVSGPDKITPEPGSAIVQDVANYVAFNQIRLDFPASSVSWTVDETKISITNDKGDVVPFTVSGFYSADNPMLQQTPNPFINFDFNANGDMPSGTYTFLANPGAFTCPAGVYEEKVTATYTYTKTKADRDETPLVIEKALMGGANLVEAGQFEWVGTDAVEVTPDMAVAQFTGAVENPTGTGFLLTLNHGEKCEYVPYQLIDNNTREVVRDGQAQKQEDGTFLIGWAITTKLFEGTTYNLEIHSYNNIQEKVEFGDGASLTFVGTTEPYHYSSAKFVTVVPSSGDILSSLKDNKITVLFTEPVSAQASYSIGMGAGTDPIPTVSATEQEFDNVWYVYIPEYVMKTYPEVNITIVAYGEDGNIVAGNNGGIEDNSANAFSYPMTLCQPRIMLGQTNSHIAKIDTFSAYCSVNKGINNGWADFPYVVNENGETVAELNMNYTTNEWGDGEPYKVLRWNGVPGAYESDPLELEFQMTPAITEKGKYTLVFPAYCFMFGTQFDGESSVAQEYDFYVVDFFPVTYTVDNNTVQLSPVELNQQAELNVEVAEGWKLDTLTINGLDVTNEVTAGRYVAPGATGPVAFAATFAYDGDLFTPVSADEIVSDLELRGWSENGNLFVGGVKEGQIVKVYTVGGSEMASTVVGADEDTVRINVPANTYIVTVTDGTRQVALKLVNK